MTRILSELLQTSQPLFRSQLNQLERVSGHQNVDIRLSVEVVQAAKQKIRQLGLDNSDTTAEELYYALLRRVDADDQRLERVLRTRAAQHISAEADLTAGLAHALQAEAVQIHGAGLKTAVLKKLLKKTPPKRLQKMLGYRSLDAMLRQESPLMLVAASRQLESTAWQRAWRDSYKALQAADIEDRALQVLQATGKRWQPVNAKIIADQAHTVLTMPELAAVILLPIPAEHPSGMVVASLALALHELNTVAAASNYLRAAQVQGDFASRVQAVASGQLQLQAPHLPQAMPWQLIQRYFATTKVAINEDIFGPYVQASDFHWHDVAVKLAELSPSLAFWQDSSYLTFLHDGKAVSLNLLDTATNACNQLAYETRGLFHAQQALWDELTLRYLNHDSVEQAVAGVLHPKLVLQRAVN